MTTSAECTESFPVCVCFLQWDCERSEVKTEEQTDGIDSVFFLLPFSSLHPYILFPFLISFVSYLLPSSFLPNVIPYFLPLSLILSFLPSFLPSPLPYFLSLLLSLLPTYLPTFLPSFLSSYLLSSLFLFSSLLLSPTFPSSLLYKVLFLSVSLSQHLRWRLIFDSDNIFKPAQQTTLDWSVISVSQKLLICPLCPPPQLPSFDKIQ